MNLFRRGMRVPRALAAPPGLIEEMSRIIKGMSREQFVAMPQLIEQAERNINRKLERIMAKLDELLDAVASQQTQIDSLITLTENLHKLVLGALGDTITPSQQMRLDAVFEAVQQNAADITAAIKDNTPEATSGAVSGGPSMADIKSDLQQGKPATGGDPVSDGTKQPEPNQS